MLLILPILLLTAQEPPIIRAEVRLINLTVAATEAASGRLVADLPKDAFEILEDGVPQKIEFFSRSADMPLRLGIVMDGSPSQNKFVKRHRRDIRSFLRTVIQQQDRVLLTGFGNRVRLLQDFTRDEDSLLDAAEDYNKKPAAFPELGPLIRREGGSAVYDGIFHTIREKLASIDTGRKALLLFSDGEDNSSGFHMLDVIEAAQKADIPVFGLHYLESEIKNARNIYGKRVMQRVAGDTGGDYFEANAGDLKSVFQQIGDQIRSSYQLAYRSSNIDKPGAFRNVTVRVKQPGVRLRHRSGYFVD